VYNGNVDNAISQGQPNIQTTLSSVKG